MLIARGVLAMATQDRSLTGWIWVQIYCLNLPLPQTHGKSHFILQAPCGFNLRSNSGLDIHDSGSCSSPIATGWCVCPLKCGCILSPLLFRGGSWSRPHFPFPSWTQQPSWDLFTSQRWMDSSHQLLVITCETNTIAPPPKLHGPNRKKKSSLAVSLYH